MATIEEMFAQSKTKEEAVKDMWTSVAVDTNISARFLCSARFREAVRATIRAGSFTYGRKDWMESLTRQKKQLISKVKERMTHRPVCLILDGWRLPHRMEHSHGFLFCDYDNNIVFHSLVVDFESHTSQYLVETTNKVIHEIEELFGVYVTSIVSDNASVMLSALRQLGETRPLLLHACSAHWLSLIMRSLCDSERVKAILNQCASIRIIFAKRKAYQALHKACESKLARMKGCSLAAPCATRWNSHLHGAVKLVRLGPAIELAQEELENPLLENASHVFHCVRSIAKVLVPLANAIDCVQSDESGILRQAVIIRELEKQIDLVKITTEDEDVRMLAEEMQSLLTERLALHQDQADNEALSACIVLCVQRSHLDDRIGEEARTFFSDRGIKILRWIAKDEFQAFSDIDLKIKVMNMLAEYIETNAGATSLELLDITDAIERWKAHLIGKFRCIALLARVLLAVRSSEAAAERAFSHGIVRTQKQRTHLKAETLDLELFVRINTRWGEIKSTHKRRKRSISKSSSWDVIEVDEGEEFSTEDNESAYVEMSEEESEEGEDINFLQCCDTCGELLGVPHDGWEKCVSCSTLYCASCKTKELDITTRLCELCKISGVLQRMGVRKTNSYMTIE